MDLNGEPGKPDFVLRSARQSDATMIINLIRRMGNNIGNLDWHYFRVVESRDGQLEGCVQCKPHWDGSSELASLAVEKTSRGRGLARALMEDLLADSPRPLFLICQPFLIPLYEKFDFRLINESDMSPYYRVVSLWMRWLPAPFRHLTRMVRRLPPYLWRPTRVMRLD